MTMHLYAVLEFVFDLYDCVNSLKPAYIKMNKIHKCLRGFDSSMVGYSEV